MKQLSLKIPVAKQQHLDLGCSPEIASYWTNWCQESLHAQHNAGFDFQSNCLGNVDTALGFECSLESASRDTFAAINVNLNTCLPHFGSTWIACMWNKHWSAWLLLNIYYFSIEKWHGENRSNQTGDCSHLHYFEFVYSKKQMSTLVQMYSQFFMIVEINNAHVTAYELCPINNNTWTLFLQPLIWTPQH